MVAATSPALARAADRAHDLAAARGYAAAIAQAAREYGRPAADVARALSARRRRTAPARQVFAHVSGVYWYQEE